MNEEKIKILIVDDEVETRETYAEIFRKNDFEVEEAEDGLEGLEKALTGKPNVIFTGIIMPRMDGFSLMEELKKNVATSKIPVVILSHMGREEDQKKANSLGAKDFIVRDMTPPAGVVERIKSIFQEGGTYLIEFDPFSLDAQKLARDTGMNNNFQCMECNERMLLKLELVDPKSKKFEAKIFCPNCGWTAN